MKTFLKKFWIYAALIILILAAYHNTFRTPFLFDDIYSIAYNPNIGQWWPIKKAFFVPFETTVANRPLLNFSFKLNYLISGLDVVSYHVANLIIHIINACLIVCILGKIFSKSIFSVSVQKYKLHLAGIIAAIWALHPLQTNAVTYIAQRAESLAVMFYLLGIGSFIFYLETQRNFWKWNCVMSAILGVLTKEICATLPIFIFFYDWVFEEGDWKNILKKRWRFYLALASSWVVLLVVIKGGYRLKMLEESTAYMSGWKYLLLQFGVITHYLKLIFWPYPLVFDYKWPEEISWPFYGIHIFLIGGLFAAGLLGLKKYPKIAFAILGFFILLAPSSSIVPLAAVVAAEYRVYFPLVFILTLVIISFFEGLGRLTHQPDFSLKMILGMCFAWAGILLVATVDRNEDYRSRLTLWENTISQQPDNPRAYNSIADEYRVQKNYFMVEKIFRDGLKKLSDDYDLLNNFGGFLAERGHGDEAMPFLQKAIRINPLRIQAYVNLGNIFLEKKNLSQAEAYYLKALQTEPEHFLAWGAWVNLGNLYFQQGNLRQANDAVRKSLAMQPCNPKALILLKQIQQAEK